MGTTVTLGKHRKAILTGAEGVPMDYRIFSWRINYTCQGCFIGFAYNWTRIGQRAEETEAQRARGSVWGAESHLSARVVWA